MTNILNEKCVAITSPHWSSHCGLDPRRKCAWTLALIRGTDQVQLLHCHQSIWRDALRSELEKFGLVLTAVVIPVWFLSQQLQYHLREY